MLLVRSMISCSIGFSPSIFIAANKSWNDLFINILVLPLACTIHYSLENGIGIKHIPILLRSTFLFYFPSIPNKSKVIWNKFQQTISGGYPEQFNPSFSNCAASLISCNHTNRIFWFNLLRLRPDWRKQSRRCTSFPRGSWSKSNYKWCFCFV